MFDNLRDNASFFDDDVEQAPEQPKSAPNQPKQRKGHFLGMSPIQRFVIALMLMIAVFMLGTLALILSGKFWLV